MWHMSSLRAGSEPDRPAKSVLRAILILLWSTCVGGINIFKNLIDRYQGYPSNNIVCLLVCLILYSAGFGKGN